MVAIVTGAIVTGVIGGICIIGCVVRIYRIRRLQNGLFDCLLTLYYQYTYYKWFILYDCYM